MFYEEWVCVFVGFVMCVSFCNMCTCVYYVLFCLHRVFGIVSFMYISYLFFLYCHGVTTQLQLVVVVVVVVVEGAVVVVVAEAVVVVVVVMIINHG
jgi:hypothetical protein